MNTVYLIVRTELNEWDAQHETVMTFLDREVAKAWSEHLNQNETGPYGYNLIMKDITTNLPS